MTNPLKEMFRYLLLALVLFGLLARWAPAEASESKVLPWMMADWENPTPHLADLGVTPRELAATIGKRLVILPHPLRDISIPGSRGPRAFSKARFVTAVSRVDLPVQTLRRRMQDFSGYKHLFPLLTGSDVMALDGKNVVARYRVEIPLPALATFTVDFRIKHAMEADGSISALLIDGKAESLIAMLGGMTDELADQPVLSRWEFLPVDDQHSLLVFTYWDRVELKSFFARKFMEAYPELKVVGPYRVAAGASEPIHRLFTTALPVNGQAAPPGLEQMAKMQALLERVSSNGHVAILEPEQAVVQPAPRVAPLRYVAVATRIQAPPPVSRSLATRYERLPEALKELKLHNVDDRGRQVDLDMTLKFAVLLIRFSIDMDVLNTWITPDRLEFRRTKGELAQLWGSSEWHPVSGSDDTLMVISAAHEVGDDAPMILRMAHKIVERVPYADQIVSLAVQMVVMERLKPWIEKNAAAEKTARPAAAAP
jgi:hypothetical protein